MTPMTDHYAYPPPERISTREWVALAAILGFFFGSLVVLLYLIYRALNG